MLHAARLIRAPIETMESPPKIIVVDDKEDGIKLLSRCARNAGLEAVPCYKRQNALAAIDELLVVGNLVGVVTDLKLDDGSYGGWAVLSHAYKKSRSLRLALVSGFIDDELSSLFDSGVIHPAFVPFSKSRTDTATKLTEWMKDARREWEEQFGVTLKDASTRKVYENIVPAFATSDLPILILGETGTGKEYLAKHIHDVSKRTKELFCPVNCGGLEPGVALAQLTWPLSMWLASTTTAMTVWPCNIRGAIFGACEILSIVLG